MPVKNYNPYTPTRRHLMTADFSDITKSRPEKRLLGKRDRSGGRNSSGRITNVNIGGGHKRRYRMIDFKRDKRGIPAKVAAIEYDPNRTSRLALLHYLDGEKRYILAPQGLRVGDQIDAGENAPVRPGNALPLSKIPEGEAIHNVELKIGRGGQLARSAGASAQLAAKEGEYGLVQLPSGEMRKVRLECYASIGAISNPDHSNIVIGKAGRSRWLGRRPHNRGISKNPVDHPMGGRTNGGKHPCSPSGVIAKGLKTRANKRTDKFIVRRRTKKKI